MTSMTRSTRRPALQSNFRRPMRAGLLTLVPCATFTMMVMERHRSFGDDSARAVAPSTAEVEETPNTPALFHARGRLVCLAEEMKERFGADVQPVHSHVLGFRFEDAAGSPGYRLILRTAQSEALFVDDRFAKHTLHLTGRVFPGTDILEVSGWRWERDGRLYDVYYWCEVCSIRGITPGKCACCQDPVELRERVIPGGGKE